MSERYVASTLLVGRVFDTNEQRRICTAETVEDGQRIAAALNQQAGVVEALRPLEEALAKHERARGPKSYTDAGWALAEAARAALAAIKAPLPEPPEVKP